MAGVVRDSKWHEGFLRELKRSINEDPDLSQIELLEENKLLEKKLHDMRKANAEQRKQIEILKSKQVDERLEIESKAEAIVAEKKEKLKNLQQQASEKKKELEILLMLANYSEFVSRSQKDVADQTQTHARSQICQATKQKIKAIEEKIRNVFAHIYSKLPEVANLLDPPPLNFDPLNFDHLQIWLEAVEARANDVEEELNTELMKDGSLKLARVTSKLGKKYNLPADEVANITPKTQEKLTALRKMKAELEDEKLEKTEKLAELSFTEHEQSFENRCLEEEHQVLEKQFGFKHLPKGF